jgi:nitroimidazol reductase NimA-like FMN-containing flavoprotein (pyridoxamine 5'-phosphate oxidase superfamily)
MEEDRVMTRLIPTERTTVHRMPHRASFDRALLERILDEAFYCHVGFVVDTQPYVIPTIHARAGDSLLLHGSSVSRMLGAAATGLPLCVTVSILDGLVLARSAYHHSMNYRSAMILGKAVEVTDTAERLDALRTIVEHVMPGRWPDVRGPNAQELKATSVLRLPIIEASVKVRSGPPLDDESDYGMPCWAGEIPLRLERHTPVADPRLAPNTALPGYHTPPR